MSRPDARLTAPRRGQIIEAGGRPHVYAPVTRVLQGHTATLDPVPADRAESTLRLAVIVPHFGFGSGGHQVVFHLAHGLQQRGHLVSYWLHDPHGEGFSTNSAELRAAVREQYSEIESPLFVGFDSWNGADVVIATGWQTVYPAMALARCRGRAYLVNDHEPEFYATSLESLFAAKTYGLGLPCIVGGGPWLADLVQQRYGAEIVARFAYPVDHELVPRPVARRDDTVVVYARDSTPRRAVGLALMAVEELKRRRPHVRVVLFGDQGVPVLPFSYEHLGCATAEELSWTYSQATVGLAFSLTHGSLVPHDMLACGLAVVDLAGFSTAAEHAGTGLVELAALDPDAIADAIERLLDDPAERSHRSAAGRRYAVASTWKDATDQVEEGLRAILRARATTTGP